MIDSNKEMQVIVTDLPYGVKGFIAEDPETGYPSIFINAHLSYKDQKTTFDHEYRHHIRGDMDSKRSIRMVEV